MKRALILAGLTACSIPDQTFEPSIDAANNTDAMIDMAIASGFVIDKQTLMITEGTSDTFSVQLASQPTNVISATVQSTSATVAVSPPTIDFTPSNWNQAVAITVTPMVDTNDIEEMSTVSIEAEGLLAGTVGIKSTDPTVIATYGWPAAFANTSPISAGSVIAYQITIPANTNLDKFGVFIPAGSGFYRMALYRDNANSPADLVGQIVTKAPLANGENVFDLMPDVPIDTSTTQLFWIALRVSVNSAVSSSPAVNGRTCARDVDITNIDTAWPASFGASTCADFLLKNLWITTYKQ